MYIALKLVNIFEYLPAIKIFQPLTFYTAFLKVNFFIGSSFIFKFRVQITINNQGKVVISSSTHSHLHAIYGIAEEWARASADAQAFDG